MPPESQFWKIGHETKYRIWHNNVRQEVSMKQNYDSKVCYIKFVGHQTGSIL